MSYRPSLGTRGELRRIAAEAETITIDRVRPWIRKVQHCRLAPHVIVPQWIRLEHPVKPRPPLPLVSKARIVSSELIEEILESATAKKFRRGRGRRGRPRRRANSSMNTEPEPAGHGDDTNEISIPNGVTTAGEPQAIPEGHKHTQNVQRPASNQEKEESTLIAGDFGNTGEEEQRSERKSSSDTLENEGSAPQEQGDSDTQSQPAKGVVEIADPKEQVHKDHISLGQDPHCRMSLTEDKEMVTDMKTIEDMEMSDERPSNKDLDREAQKG